MKAVVINLERRKDRLEHIHTHYKNELFTLEILKAFDGKYLENNSPEYITLKNEFLQNIELNKTKNINYPYCYFSPFTLGELGCFLSHLIIWKKIIDENIESLIIFEDDCIFNSKFNVTLNKILTDEIPEDFNIIYLGGKTGDNYFSDLNIKVSENISIKKDFHPNGAFSYILSNKGARLLYDYILNNFKGNLGVDYFIDEFFIKNNHNIHMVYPFITYSISNNDGEYNIFKTDIR
jgi:glycosyl transferase family 25